VGGVVRTGLQGGLHDGLDRRIGEDQGTPRAGGVLLEAGGRWPRKRWRQRATVLGFVPSSWAIWRFWAPSAARKTIRARKARRWGVVWA
jgi:hypothetical protein